MPQFASSINQYPGRASLAWYALLIVVGTAVLFLITACAASPDRPISFLDALFTSTSASCVTGLAVRSTVHDFSFAGQAVILGLIQLGGIGIMTVTTFIVVQFNRSGSLRQRKAIADTLGAGEGGDLRVILRNVLAMTAAFELGGFLLLVGYNQANFARFEELGVWTSRGEATWHALFHSVSAFCNAGFSLHDQSLIPFADSFVVNATIGLLVVVGGLGFPVVNDLWKCRKKPAPDRWGSLQLHSKIMLIGTGVLLAFGFISFLALEHDGVLAEDPFLVRIYKAAFHSVTCRTAGFNTVEIAELTNAMLFISILLMMVGGGPCSTAGGFKVSTAAIIALRAWATFQGYTRVNLFRRTLPVASVERAVATAMLFVTMGGVALTALLVIEQSEFGHRGSSGLFLEMLFEVISALGTVGLSIGLTTDLKDPSRVIMVLLMLMGRLGPITAFAALSHGARTEPVEFPNEEPIVG
ncbi:Ktr system potassium uptake protein B [Botrimarina colliarenosi]|uniref:Ktr system potassium uptake protein B n=1 Tax=Botrimarina colliarenosi TaxID=2528001 RepID=A0A5C6AJA3_9BACT|nr:potassium transporter TrkG [Botrimarina colliarenosi]TWU00105.1 Ktr system potassium uptake protein B [Botrimarina colliarenosi]